MGTFLRLLLGGIFAAGGTGLLGLLGLLCLRAAENSASSILGVTTMLGILLIFSVLMFTVAGALFRPTSEVLTHDRISPFTWGFIGVVLCVVSIGLGTLVVWKQAWWYLHLPCFTAAWGGAAIVLARRRAKEPAAHATQKPLPSRQSLINVFSSRDSRPE